MALQSSLFRGDSKLEAAAVSDDAHILPGATGPHVGKIQQALIELDGADLTLDAIYGPATAAAVLAYKQTRNIVNLSYQTTADNIVGKMTIAALDSEILSKEVLPSGPTRFEPIFPIQGPSQPRELPQSASRLLLGFKVAIPFADEIPALPPSLTLTPSTLEVPANQVGSFRVLNGIGKEIVVGNPSIATIAPINLPANAHTLTRVKITEDPQMILVFAKRPGRTSISVQPFSLFDPFMTVIVAAEVQVFFHFLAGPAGIKTVRSPSDLVPMLRTVNDIYQRNHAGFSFVNAGVNPGLTVPGLVPPGVRVDQRVATPDTNRIKAFQKADILFNVFFLGKFIDTSLSGTSSDFLALTSRPPNDDSPLRCCLFRDSQSGDPPGIDPGQALAHEAGHALGEDDDKQDSSSLMFFAEDRKGTQIDAKMARRMLASFNEFPP